MLNVNMHEAKTQLSALVARVEEKGEIINLCRNGKPVAQILPLKPKKNPLKMIPSLKVKFLEDPTKPLDQDDWPEDLK